MPVVAGKTRRSFITSFTSYSRQLREAGRRWFTGNAPLAVCATLPTHVPAEKLG
jgi:hypothetical protein